MAASDAEISEHLQRILQSDEFSDDVSDRLLQRLREWFDGFRVWSSELGFWPRMVLLAVCAGLLVYVAWQVLATMHRASLPASGGKAGFVAPAGRPPTALWLQRARSLADAGQVRDAARALQQAVLLHMCEERAVPWHASRADWEWVELLRPPARAVAFMRATQRLAFGPDPEPHSFSACMQEAEILLRSDTRRIESVAGASA